MITGHSTNPKGRPIGRLDDTTLIANEKMRSLAERAVDVLAAGLDSPVDWVRYGAARTVLERTLPKDGPVEPADASWIGWATDKELRMLERLIARCKERMPVNVVDEDAPDVIDVPARVLPPAPSPSPAEPFDLSTIPAPGNGQPEEPEEPDYEEFGGEDDHD
jgi:hypothetical protein